MSVDEPSVCDCSNESHWVALSYGTIYHAVQNGSSLFSLWMKPLCVIIPMEAIDQNFYVALFFFFQVEIVNSLSNLHSLTDKSLPVHLQEVVSRLLTLSM